MAIRFGIVIDAISEVSVIVGTLWEDLPEEKKEIFRAEARRLKEEHMVSFSYPRSISFANVTDSPTS